ncbi:MAG: archaeosortase/exosortase family protein [Candidatus Bathyarchaeota archaeon]|nr:archaeosortase/exosortase family protein [Candidatus Bathyarchaeum sp.]
MISQLKEQIKKQLDRMNNPSFLQFAIFFAAFVVPVLALYIRDASMNADSFDYLWKGRAPYFLFLWLLVLEAALGWKKLKTEQTLVWTKKTVLVAVTLILPTIYAVGLNFGLYDGIVELGKAVGVPVEQYGEWYLTHSWPFSFEYVLFALLFVTSIWLMYKKQGLKLFAVSSFFIGGVGIFYMIDTFYPYGTFTVLQAFVPVTVSGAVLILNILGYGTRTFSGGGDGLGLTVTGANSSYSAIVSWSCAGSHSLFLYSFMIMLFLRGTSISRTRKIIYVLVGAAGTFFVNILRIVAILLAGVNSGASLAATFHEFYGEFFFIAWMFIYLSIIFLVETRVINKKDGKEEPIEKHSDESQFG